MATLYKHGKIITQHTIDVIQRDESRITYIFRLMGDGYLLVRARNPQCKWRVLRRKATETDFDNLVTESHKTLRLVLDNCFN